MSIILFYSMPGCGFCSKAESELQSEISSGKVKKLPHTQAPSHVNGFPHFTCNNKSSSGYINKKSLFIALNYSSNSIENYKHNNQIKYIDNFIGI
jgi:hypothetical protein